MFIADHGMEAEQQVIDLVAGEQNQPAFAAIRSIRFRGTTDTNGLASSGRGSSRDDLKRPFNDQFCRTAQ
jgi:hypothetical protein